MVRLVDSTAMPALEFVAIPVLPMGKFAGRARLRGIARRYLHELHLTFGRLEGQTFADDAPDPAGKQALHAFWPFFILKEIRAQLLDDVRISRCLLEYFIQSMIDAASDLSLHSGFERFKAFAPQIEAQDVAALSDRKSTRLNSSHEIPSRMPSSA